MDASTPPHLALRRAVQADLDFLTTIDLLDEGITLLSQPQVNEATLSAHRPKIEPFISSPAAAAWVVEDLARQLSVAALMVRFRDRWNEEPTPANQFLLRYLDERIFPPDGKFCEVFGLWVHPAYRRQGLATRLKQQGEKAAIARGLRLIYTHTEATNTHVLELNLKLGYREVRRGPIWDEIVRVSLVKELIP